MSWFATRRDLTAYRRHRRSHRQRDPRDRADRHAGKTRKAARPKPVPNSPASAPILASIPSAFCAFTKSSESLPSKRCAKQLESGEIEKRLGLRMAQHVRQGLTETHAMLLYRADDLRARRRRIPARTSAVCAAPKR